MKPTVLTLTAIAALASLPVLTPALTAALAQDSLVAWGNAGGWDIMVDSSLGNGCLITSEFEDGSVVRIGFDRTQGNGYITSMNANWGDIVEGQTYPISIALDGNSFDGEATGLVLDGLPGADVVFDNIDFFAGLAQHQTLTLSHDGAEVMSLDLTGTAEALDQLVACQDQQEG